MSNTTKPLITHIIYRLDIGGLENGLVNIINRLPRDHFRHAIICLTDYTEFRQRIEPEVEVIALHKRSGKDPGLYWRLFKAMWQLKPDIVHTRNLTTLEAQPLAWLAGVKYRIHGLHGWDVHDMNGENVRYQKLYRMIDRFVHRYIPLSDDLESYLLDKIGVDSEKITKICNGVDTDKFCPGSSCPHPSPLPGGEGMVRANRTTQTSPLSPWERERVKVIGTVGRLEPVKDQPNLVHAFIRLIKQYPNLKEDTRLMLVGDGSLRPEIEQLLKQAGLQELVWLAGSRDDVPELLREMDIFVLPSKAEGISNTILEAMACGLPVLATKVGGNEQLIVAGETGDLVPKENPEVLAQALYNYLSKPELIEQQARNAKQRALEYFSLDKMVGEYQKVYQKR